MLFFFSIAMCLTFKCQDSLTNCDILKKEKKKKKITDANNCTCDVSHIDHMSVIFSFISFPLVL